MIQKKDLEIISHLRQNARMPLTKMSRKTNIPVSTIFDRLKMNEEKYILKHTCLLDFSKLGYSIRANITIKADKNEKEELKDFLLKHHSVNSVYKITSGYDFMVEGVFRHIKDMEEFMEQMEGRFKILEQNSYFIIEDLKREEFMSDTDLILQEVS